MQTRGIEKFAESIEDQDGSRSSCTTHYTISPVLRAMGIELPHFIDTMILRVPLGPGAAGVEATRVQTCWHGASLLYEEIIGGAQLRLEQEWLEPHPGPRQVRKPGAQEQGWHQAMVEGAVA